MNSSSEFLSQEQQVALNLDLFGLIRRRYRLMLAVQFIVFLLAWLFYLLQEPRYESHLEVLVGQQSTELTSTGTRNQEGKSVIQEEILSTHMELFRSQKVIELAIATYGLSTSVAEVAKNLAISKGGEGGAEKASVLKATYRDTDPARAAEVLSSLFKSYQAYIRSQAKSVGSEAATLIAKGLRDNEQELRQADRAYTDFIQSVPALMSSSGEQLGDVHRMRLAKLEEELASIRKTEAESIARRLLIKNSVAGKKPAQISELDVMLLLTDEELARILGLMNVIKEKVATDEKQLSLMRSEQSTRTEYQRLLDLMGKERVLSASLGSAHPSIASVRAEIDSVKDFMRANNRQISSPKNALMLASPATMLNSFYRLLEHDIQSLELREQELLKLCEEEIALAKEVEVGFLVGNSMKSNLDRAQARYDEVFQRLQEIKLTSDYVGFSSDVLSAPAANPNAVWPSESKIFVFALLLGGMVGFGLAVVAELRDQTFRDPADVERSLKARILAHLPALRDKQSKRPCIAAIGGLVAPTPLPTPDIAQAEMFRELRTSILHDMKKGCKRVLMVTSPSPGDGKTTTVCNLAVCMAQAGKRVLIVDGDLRRPSVRKSLGLELQPGLSNYLLADEAFERCVHPARQPNLFVCGEGTCVSNPAEALQCERMSQFLTHCRDQFDFILIDTPPVLAVADPTILAEVVDGSILLITIKRNNRRMLERAAEILREHDIHLMGLLVNSNHRQRTIYGYSSYNYLRESAQDIVAGYRQEYLASQVGDAPVRSPLGPHLPQQNGRRRHFHRAT